MPTYDYICENCGYEFEYFQSMSSEPIKVCPICEQTTVMRKISGGTGLIFKGSGFYITDYTNKKSSPSSPSNDKTDSVDTKPTAAKEIKESKKSDL
ncbi:zinc ribbon domain-containing protein [bacterium]|nr:zinc ribbon domain-containing protein [bacterium]MBU1066114.1 zinc ribbon domain-containing protein [bacterium]MBU1633967.1 zinc ribbon domain-containing protein [bacterium]MBU1875181.1 zinc ribbon domain-containing protein [bacterium]